MSHVENKKSLSGVKISDFEYFDSGDATKQNDLVGNRRYMKFADDSYVLYTYDSLYRLTEEARFLSDDTKVYKYNWTYDWAGNRLTQRKYTKKSGEDEWECVDYVEYQYNQGNQLTYFECYDNDTPSKTQYLAVQLVYDKFGNRTEKNIENSSFTQPISYNDENWEYTYDVHNRMNFIEKDSNDLASWTFNALGNRVKKYIYAGSLTTKMLYDGADCVSDYDANTDLLQYYITPMLDENLLLNEGSEDFYFTHDGLGSVREILDSSQTTQKTYDFYAFGSEKSSTGNLTNRFTFTGRELDTETESANSTALYYYRARMYDPETGTFTGRDPIGEIAGNNLYCYTQSNPTTFNDPFGLLDAFDRRLVNLSDAEVQAKYQSILRARGAKGAAAFLCNLENARNRQENEKFRKPCRVGITCGPDIKSTGHHILSKTTYDCQNYEKSTSFADAVVKAVKCSGTQRCLGCIDRIDFIAEEKDINWTLADLDDYSEAAQYIERLDLCQPCDIWIASCRFCANSDGRNFAQRLAKLTGCTVHCTRYFITLGSGEFKVTLTKPNTMTKFTSSVGVLGIGMLAVGILLGNPFLIGAGIGAIAIGAGINLDSFGDPFANPRTVLKDPWQEYK